MGQFQFLSWFYNLRVNFLLQKVKGTAVTCHAQPYGLRVVSTKGRSVSTDARLGFLKLEKELIARRGGGMADGTGSAPPEIWPPLYVLPWNCKMHPCSLGLGLLGPPGFSTTQLRSAVWAPKRALGCSDARIQENQRPGELAK